MYRTILYNLKIIFANKFIFFLGAALAIFIFVTLINLFNAESNPTEGTIYWLLLVPGILLIFYPIIFGIQNDVDTRMIEILFGIPNYRYKVWLVRLILIFLVTSVIISLLSAVSSFVLTSVPVYKMVFQIMFPIMFLGCAAFMVSTIVRNGSGTAVVMVILGMAFWITRDFFNDHKKWDLFLNPFVLPDNMNEAVWAEIVLQNRVYLFAGIILTLLAGLLNLQKREKFL
ncbi:MAG: hypothetical protein HOC71_08335 [Candidatus Latescibacteria bacterium]|nr:hypothetical protein [Candidatus Latescibacterota bacterium]